MFKGVDFIFDDIPSETYGLKIGIFSKSGLEDSISGLRRSIEEYKIKRKSKPLFQGIEISEKIEFDLVLYSETEIDTWDRQFIDSWLYKNQYKYFSIIQEDFENIYFNCIITKGDKLTVGNIPYAITIHIICDDSYAYTGEYEYEYVSTNATSTTLIRNLSNMNDYTWIEDMTITMTSSGDVSITNMSESNRLFQLTSMSNGEVLTVNNDKKILDSSVSDNRIGNFNKKWFRLVPEDNTLMLQGNFNLNLKVRYKRTI